jgi:hypothetical protein
VYPFKKKPEEMYSDFKINEDIPSLPLFEDEMVVKKKPEKKNLEARHFERCSVCRENKPSSKKIEFFYDTVQDAFNALKKKLTSGKDKSMAQHWVWNQMPLVPGDEYLWSKKDIDWPNKTDLGRTFFSDLKEAISKDKRVPTQVTSFALKATRSAWCTENCRTDRCFRHPHKEAKLTCQFRMGVDLIDGSFEVPASVYEALVARFDSKNILLTQKDWESFGVSLCQYMHRAELYDDKGDPLVHSVRRSQLFKLRTLFGVDHECFASPHASTLTFFNSPFVDTDFAFGSEGSFFDMVLPRSSKNSDEAYEVNPPWTAILLMDTMVHLMTALRRADSVNKGLAFFVFMSSWDDSEASNYLGQKDQSKFIFMDILLPQGTSYLSTWKNKESPVGRDQRFVVMGSKTMRDKWSAQLFQFRAKITSVFDTKSDRIAESQPSDSVFELKFGAVSMDTAASDTVSPVFIPETFQA